MPRVTWDIFCKVVDNHGDLGVCWRLASQVASRGDAVRLWVDDASALSWMAPAPSAGVQLRVWGSLPGMHEEPVDVLIEAFGCDVPPDFIAACASRVAAGAARPVWINLEYLSAEGWVAGCHRLPSPVQHGPAAGWTKWFFYPGFTAETGGLLRETALVQRRLAFDREVWRAAQPGQPASPDARWVSLFCYEPPALSDWMVQAAHGPEPTRLLVTPGRALAAVQAAEENLLSKNATKRLWHKRSQLSILNIPHRSQTAYDELLWACDLNFVRGEDSLVRALWAGNAFVWHIYPQDDGAHGPKLRAFLDWLQAPASLRHFHEVWNGLAPGPLPEVTSIVLCEWSACALVARTQLLQQHDLLTQLLGFCAAKR